MTTLHVLIVEDSENDAQLLVLELRRGGFDVHHNRVDTEQGMTAALRSREWNLIIADYSMPQFSGAAALVHARHLAVDVPFMLVSGTVGEATAVEAMKAGASDYLFKGDLTRLVPAVQRELRGVEERRLARKTEQLLQSRETQLAEALHLAKLGTWNLDLQTDSTDLSDEAVSLLGRTSGASPPTFTEFLSCLHPDDRDAFTAAFFNRLTTQIAQDCRLVSSDTAVKFVHVRGNILRDDQGNATIAGGMIQDITERKQADAELLKLKESAESANRAKSEFLANMSHELRTPMSAILGFADMMSETGKDAPDHKECIQIIRRNANHLLALINEILDLSKIEAGHMALERVQCDLPTLLSEVASSMRSRAVDKSLDFNVALDGLLPRYVLSDPLRVRQILVNLLGNAIKFTAAGSVEMLVCCEEIGKSTMLAIEIRDTGIGMTPEQLRIVFDPFTQAEQSTTRKFGGTGLGLAISRRLAQLMNGEITVSSEKGAGTVFTVMVETGSVEGVEKVSTLQQACPAPPASAKLLTEQTISAHVLLVEDGRDNQRLLSTHLKMAGATVEIAENGGIAVELASSQAFDLILMDMQMPVMDGYTATAELRRRGITIPIIALTAHAMSEDRGKCLASGCTDYLSKPVKREVLLTTIRQHLGQPAQKQGRLPDAQPAEVAEGAVSAGILRSSLMNYPGMAPIIIDFVRDLPAQVEQLQSFLRLQELDPLRRLIHQLRGSCGGYGFDAITTVASAAEDSIKTGQPPMVISSRVNSLIQIIQHIEGYDSNESRLAA